MKKLVLSMIEAWQKSENRPRGLCLQTPTCSAYGHRVISQYGVLRGGLMTAWRIFKCNGLMSSAQSDTSPGNDVSPGDCP
jgi:uncharacterized protein